LQGRGITHLQKTPQKSENVLVRESSVTAVRSEESFMRTEQLPENQIAQFAHATV
jgi:hypothetical protein